MGYAAVSIPEKIFFKIGEVCDIVDVQAHVLRYWETEFPQLSPQKNRSGQRSYRRRDVEIALRIKELLYIDEYTIAGARKKLQGELRESSRLKIVPNDPPRLDEFATSNGNGVAEEFGEIGDFDAELEVLSPAGAANNGVHLDADRRQAIQDLASQLLELREMLRSPKAEAQPSNLRKY